jgi:hypothetical protein
MSVTVFDHVIRHATQNEHVMNIQYMATKVGIAS